MKVRQLQELLSRQLGHAEVFAHDPEVGQDMPVTGIVFGNVPASEATGPEDYPVVYLQTDDIS